MNSLEKIFPLIRKISQERYQDLGFSSEGEMLFPLLNHLSDPFSLDGIEEVVKRILLALERREKIVIYGDFDLDGISSTALMMHLLRAYGADVCYSIPRKGVEGYGLSAKGLARCFDICGVPDLLIALDCGTNSFAEVDWLKENGVETLILDHHPLLAKLPSCPIVNPQISGFEWNYLSAVGVVFKVCHGLLKRQSIQHFSLKEHLPYVALGTLSDLVPLIKENRILVSHGVQELLKTSHSGLKTFGEKFSAKKNILDYISFQVAPRLNSCGRLDKSELAMDILLEKDSTKSKALLEKIEDCNSWRKKEQQKGVDEILKESSEFPQEEIFTGDWHSGVLGIMASFLSHRWEKPIFVLTEKEGILFGSGRSIEGISLVEFIESSSDILSGGGHSLAAGISLKKEHLPLLKERFSQFSRERKGGKKRGKEASYPLSFSEINSDLFSSYLLLSPFGKANLEPLFFSTQIFLEKEISLKGGHKKLWLKQGEKIQEALYFSSPETLPSPPWKVFYSLRENKFRGEARIQIFVQRIEVEQP